MSISGSAPTARAIRQPAARCTRYSSNAVLPTPASPWRTSTRLLLARTLATSRSKAAHSLRRPRSLYPGASQPNIGGRTVVSGRSIRISLLRSAGRIASAPPVGDQGGVLGCGVFPVEVTRVDDVEPAVRQPQMEKFRVDQRHR